MPLRDKKGLERAKAIMKYTDSESNELMIGVLHMSILPFAMFELGKPWVRTPRLRVERRKRPDP